jgi:hypothetical protein
MRAIGPPSSRKFSAEIATLWAMSTLPSEWPVSPERSASQAAFQASFWAEITPWIIAAASPAAMPSMPSARSRPPSFSAKPRSRICWPSATVFDAMLTRCVLGFESSALTQTSETICHLVAVAEARTVALRPATSAPVSASTAMRRARSRARSAPPPFSSASSSARLLSTSPLAAAGIFHALSARPASARAASTSFWMAAWTASRRRKA